jgi:hypothetical protein
VVRAGADKIRDADGNQLTGIQVTFQIAFPGGAGGGEARAILPDAVKKSHDRLCTVYLDNLGRYLPHSGRFRARKSTTSVADPGRVARRDRFGADGLWSDCGFMR